MIANSQIERYHQDGFLYVDDFINTNDVQNLLSQIPALMKGNFHSNYKPSVFKVENSQQTNQIAGRLWEIAPTTIGKLLLSPKIGQICAMLGNWKKGTRAIHSSFWFKNPGALGVAYHQDATFTQIFHSNDIIIVYIPLQNMTKAAGSVEYIKGSHQWGLSQRVKFHREDYTESLDILFENPIVKDELEIISYDAPVGSCIFHNGLTLHGSKKNETFEPRIGITLVAISAESIVNSSTYNLPHYVFEINDDYLIPEEKYPIIWSADGYVSPKVSDIFGYVTDECKQNS